MIFPVNVKEVQYYINNNCNLSCNNCSSFNNLKLQGYFKWEEHKNKNSEWPKYINPGRVSILGGETFLNPDLINWVRGVRESWRNHNNITVTTNGTLLDRSKARSIAKEIIKLGLQLEISVHYEKDYKKIYATAEKILQELGIPYSTKFSPIDLSGYDDRTTFFHRDQGHILYTIHRKYQFESSSIESVNNNIINFYKSDKVRAHNVCIFRECHYIVHGDLYKCVVTATAPQLTKYYETNNNELIKRYIPCDPFDTKENILKFLQEIKNPIDQCELCPVNVKVEKIK